MSNQEIKIAFKNVAFYPIVGDMSFFDDSEMKIDGDVNTYKGFDQIVENFLQFFSPRSGLYTVVGLEDVGHYTKPKGSLARIENVTLVYRKH